MPKLSRKDRRLKSSKWKKSKKAKATDKKARKKKRDEKTAQQIRLGVNIRKNIKGYIRAHASSRKVCLKELTARSLHNYTIKELIAIAKSWKIKGYSKHKKKDALIAFIWANRKRLVDKPGG